MPDLPMLPIGKHTFKAIRENNCLYIDKTAYIAQMIKTGFVYFLARPRRFGKSLTISTLDALFSGEKELFAGLDIEKDLNDVQFRPRPVLWFDLSAVSITNGFDAMKRNLVTLLENNANRYHLKLRGKDVNDIFGNLIIDLRAKGNEDIVILIDEYDHPIVQAVTQNLRKWKVTKTRNIMRDFFTIIKTYDKAIRFVFITGVSRFSRMGIFSALNNLKDISIDPRYGAMLGYTQAEVDEKLKPYIKDAADALTDGDTDELLKRFKEYYDGFCFDGKTFVYNPFSSLLFFDMKQFDNFWFTSGTPIVIADYMKSKKIIVDQLSNITVPRQFAVDPGEITMSIAVSYLYQSGYLSLRPGDSPNTFKLDYPNQEIRTSMSSLMMWNIFGDQVIVSQEITKLATAFDNCDTESIMREFNKLLAKVSHSDYAKANRNDLAARNPKMHFVEYLYRAVLLAFMEGAGVRVQPEAHGCLGQVDLMAERGGRTWVIELKVAKTTDAVEGQADAAMEQIHAKAYARPYDNPIRLGIAIDDSKRGIGGYRLNDEPFRAVEPQPYVADDARPGLGYLWRMVRRLIGE